MNWKLLALLVVVILGLQFKDQIIWFVDYLYDLPAHVWATAKFLCGVYAGLFVMKRVLS